MKLKIFKEAKETNDMSEAKNYMMESQNENL
jgi:hypothetical protein